VEGRSIFNDWEIKSGKGSTFTRIDKMLSGSSVLDPKITPIYIVTTSGVYLFNTSAAWVVHFGPIAPQKQFLFQDPRAEKKSRLCYKLVIRKIHSQKDFT
jgi:hypothetical protein